MGDAIATSSFHGSLSRRPPSLCLRRPCFNSVRLSCVFDLFDYMGDRAFTADEIVKALTRLGLETDSDDSTLRSTVDSSAQPANPGLTFADFEALHNELEIAWVGQLTRQAILNSKPKDNVEHACESYNACVCGKVTIPVAKHEEGQKFDKVGPEYRLFFGFCYAFGKSTPVAPINAFNVDPLYQRFWGFIGPDLVNFVKNWWDGRASIAGIAKTIWFDCEVSLMDLAAGSIITDDALAVLEGCVNFLTNNVVVCFKALWCISILLPEFGESGRDHPLQCFFESLDPSVNGCTSRQRRLRRGRAEASNAFGRILSFKSFDDSLIFRILRLYFLFIVIVFIVIVNLF